jgi:hypothetical protein
VCVKASPPAFVPLQGLHDADMAFSSAPFARNVVVSLLL